MQEKLILAGFFIFGILGNTMAQFPGSFGSGGSPSAPQQQNDVEPDSLHVQYIYQDLPEQLAYFSDTLLNNYFEQYDPARKRVVDYAQLGNLGTALLPQYYESRDHKGLDFGFHQYDAYHIHYKDIPYHIADRPFSDFYFAQGPTQNNTYFKAKFSRDFANNLTLAIDYSRMNNSGQLKSQTVINNAFGIGLWYNDSKGKYDAFLTMTSNSNDAQDNGGVDTSSLDNTNLERVFNIPVNLSSAQTYYLQRTYAFSQQLNLLGTRDSTGKALHKRAFTLHHDLVYNTKKFKFYDEAPPDDTLYYEHLLIDQRGLRYYIEDRSIENTFAISTSKNGTKSLGDLLKVGLEHQIHFLKQEPRDSTINQLILSGQWRFAPSEQLNINTYLRYNLWDNFGDYRLGGDLYLDFKKAGFFKASVANHFYSPSLIQRQMFISEQSLWRNDFDKTLETNLSATYSLPKIGFTITGQYHLLNNLIYFDALAFPQQTGTPISILQLLIQQDFKVWKFHLDNTIAFQTASASIIRLPEFFSKHNFYFEGKVFKKNMLLRVGMDLRMLSTYNSNIYQPLIGQFHNQNALQVPFYPAVDAYMSFKVKHFRFFVKTENLTHFLDDQLYYQVAGYAQPYFTIKFGLGWQLLN